MRRKFNTDEERIAARRISNRTSQQRRRANIKLAKKAVTTVNFPTNFDVKYHNDLYEKCAVYPFNYSLTLTNKKLVTGNMHNRSVDILISEMVAGSMTNYIKTNEFLGGNYHSHIVFLSTLGLESLKKYLDSKWGNGFYRLKPICTNKHRLHAIAYCFKQLKPTSDNSIMQFLVDTWSIKLIQKFADWEQQKKDTVATFKKENDYSLPIDFSKYNYKSFVSKSKEQ